MNAVKFTPSGHIRFGVNLRNDYSLEFFVEDTGIGIPQDHIKTIFDRFTQVDTESKRIFGGTGLGLTISKMIIEMMGGEIYVRSKPGEGSKFIFTLPYSPAVELKNTKIQKEKNKPKVTKYS
jgi:signal transduction histidine kinase